MVRRWRAWLAVGSAATGMLLGAGPVWACAGLVTPGGNVRLLRTATLAAYHEGAEHYVTAFSFEGGGAEFGSIVPLPGIPSTVERGGDWTLQRLEREVTPVQAFSAAPGAGSASNGATVIYETRIDALDITILKGGGVSVGDWARQHGFQLTPDAPEVLDFYAQRSPIFMAARFNAQAARDRGQRVGDGTPIHLTIPLSNPWVPLRILGLGNDSSARIGADVFLLTDRRPALLPAPGTSLGSGLVAIRDEQASPQLLADLRSDKGMAWVPPAMWFTAFRVDETTRQLRYDLAVDASGAGRPSWVAAGLSRPRQVPPSTTPPPPPTTATSALPVSSTGVSAPPTTGFALTRPAAASRSDRRGVWMTSVTLGALAMAAGVTVAIGRRRRQPGG